MTIELTGPVEAHCDGCGQLRPLFRYEPDCGLHLGALGFTCPWCTIKQQPLLCARCWSDRKETEDNDPALIADVQMWTRICEGNERAVAQSDADRAACEGIAAATARAEAGQ